MMLQPNRQLTRGLVFFWILCLAALAVGARNFEPGLSIDALLYASISRHIAVSGEWFRLCGDIPHFNPFVEHPHLGFWVTALFFKMLPAADWVARMPGHVWYVLSLFALFLFVREVSGERPAVWTVLLLWVWPTFANYFSTFYLDPGLLFFGIVSLMAAHRASVRGQALYAWGAGASLALAFMYKGLAALGFAPTLALALLWGGGTRERAAAAWLRLGLGALVGCAAVLAVYVVLLRSSAAPDFLAQYFDRQWHARFESAYSPASGVPWSEFARAVLRLGKDTFGLALLMPLGLYVTSQLPGMWRRWDFWMPLSLLGTFLAMYAPASRLGGQYWVTVLPWCAWLVGVALAWLTSWVGVRSLLKATGGFAILAVVVIQYLPFRTHHFEPPQGALDVRAAAPGPRLIYLDEARKSDFVLASMYAWYGDARVQWAAPALPPPASSINSFYFFDGPPVLARQVSLRAAGWCRWRNYGQHELWRGCAWAAR